MKHRMLILLMLQFLLFSLPGFGADWLDVGLLRRVRLSNIVGVRLQGEPGSLEMRLFLHSPPDQDGQIDVYEYSGGNQAIQHMQTEITTAPWLLASDDSPTKTSYYIRKDAIVWVVFSCPSTPCLSASVDTVDSATANLSVNRQDAIAALKTMVGMGDFVQFGPPAAGQPDSTSYVRKSAIRFAEFQRNTSGYIDIRVRLTYLLEKHTSDPATITALLTLLQ